MTGDIFIVCMGVVCYLIGFFFGKVFGARIRNGDMLFGKVFGARIRNGDMPEKCETLEDILKREG